MKFGELKSIAHNISDSLGSGIGLLIGVYESDIYAEAASGPEGYIDVDFLTGTYAGGMPSPHLARAVRMYAQAFPKLCAQHGTTPDVFRLLKTRYVPPATFIVTIEDQHGRVSMDEYVGRPGGRPKMLDELGRVRTRKGAVSRSEE